MKIETKEYYWTCGEPNCCDEYGIILYINGEEVKDRNFSDSHDAYLYVLEEMLGYEVTHIDSDDIE